MVAVSAALLVSGALGWVAGPGQGEAASSSTPDGYGTLVGRLTAEHGDRFAGGELDPDTGRLRLRFVGEPGADARALVDAYAPDAVVVTTGVAGLDELERALDTAVEQVAAAFPDAAVSGGLVDGQVHVWSSAPPARVEALVEELGLARLVVVGVRGEDVLYGG